MKKFLALFLSVLMVMGGVAWAEDPAPEPEAAPPSQEFLDWQPPKRRKKEAQETVVQAPVALRSSAVEDSTDEIITDDDFVSQEVEEEPEEPEFFGLIPSPLDWTHLSDTSEETDAGSLSGVYIPPSAAGAGVSDSSYTSKENLTDVRNQGSYGTCWAHGAMGAVEAYAKKNGLGTLDLSELHMAWFVYNGAAGKAFDRNSTSDGILDQGGNADQAIAFMSRTVGPTLEEKLPYTQIVNADNPGTVQSTPESYPLALWLKQAYRLGEVTSSNRNTIKQHILDYGAVQVSYYSNGQTTSTKSSGDEADGAYNNSSNGKSYYDTTGGTSTNHVVMIVGWNDNYSKSNFNPKPASDGAWLVKNSWGTGWGDSGYFWMSYAQYITAATVYVVESAPSNMNAYVYDELGQTGSIGLGSTTGWMANVFKADHAEELTLVGFNTTDTSTSYTINVYTGSTTAPSGSPTADMTLQPSATTSGTLDHAGYHTVPLPSSVSLTAGQYFSVVVKLTNASYAYPIPTETSAKWSSGRSYASPVISKMGYTSSNGTSWTNKTAVDVCLRAFTEDANDDFRISTAGLAEGIVNIAYSQTLATRNASGTVTWSATGLPAGLSISSTTGEISGTPTAAGTYSVTVTAQSGGKTAERSFSLIIRPAGKAPSITTSSLSSGTVGKSYSMTLSATGTAPITWTKTSGSLPTGLSLSTAGVISGTPTKTGTYSFTVQAKNSIGVASKTYSLVINAAGTSTGTKPAVSTSSLAVATIGKSYSATISVTGSPMPTVTVTGLPSGLSFNASTRFISGTPTVCGKFTVKVTAKNEKGTVTKSLKLVVNAVNPTTTTTSLPVATIGKSYSATITVTGNPTPTVTVSGLPSGLSFNASSKKISGTPTKCGTFTVKVKAKNAGATVTRSLRLVVNAVNPVISTSSLPAGTIGKGYNATVAVTGNPAPKVTASGLPSGLRYSSGTISGTPTKCGTFTVTFTAKNAGATVTKSLKLVINAVNPVISTSSLTVGTIGKSYSAAITVTGNPKPTVTAGGLPAGLKCASGKISGTPTVCGTFTVTIAATNVGATVTKPLKLTINAVNPVISTSSLVVGTIGKSYNAAIAVTGNPVPTVTVSGLPSGLSYNASSKKINGTPKQCGTFTVTVTAKNAGATVTKSLKLTINAVKPAIKTSSLAAATVGKAYSAAITTTGDPAPTVSASGLPSGLSFNTSSKTISGTPKEAGTFTVTVTAKNAGGTVTKSLKLKVAATKAKLAGQDDADEVDGGNVDEVVLIPDANQNRADLKCVSGDVVLGVVRARPGEALAFQVGAWRDIAGNTIVVTDLTVCVDGEPVEAEVDGEGVFTLPGFDEGEYAVSVMANSFGQMLKSREVVVAVGEVSLSAASQTADGGGSGCDAGFGTLAFAAVAVSLVLGFRGRKNR